VTTVILTDCVYRTSDDSEYVRCKIGDHPWELLTMDEYLARIDALAEPPLLCARPSNWSSPKDEG
jgi:hypothetical protein